MVKIYRQGDILIVKVDPSEVYGNKMDTKIIEKGELTGHAHMIENGDLFAPWGRPMFIKARENTVIVHDEHDPIDLPGGSYKIIRQRTYTGPVGD